MKVSDTEKINKFMGLIHWVDDGNIQIWKDEKSGRTDDVHHFNYSKDWNELMAVVEKIESLSCHVVFHASTIYIYREAIDDDIVIMKYTEKRDKINTAYRVIVEFINWYNKQDKI